MGSNGTIRVAARERASEGTDRQDGVQPWRKPIHLFEEINRRGEAAHMSSPRPAPVEMLLSRAQRQNPGVSRSSTDRPLQAEPSPCDRRCLGLASSLFESRGSPLLSVKSSGGPWEIIDQDCHSFARCWPATEQDSGIIQLNYERTI